MIYAEINEKPAHHADMMDDVSDEEDDQYDVDDAPLTLHKQ